MSRTDSSDGGLVSVRACGSGMLYPRDSVDEEPSGGEGIAEPSATVAFISFRVSTCAAGARTAAVRMGLEGADLATRRAPEGRRRPAFAAAVLRRRTFGRLPDGRGFDLAPALRAARFVAGGRAVFFFAPLRCARRTFFHVLRAAAACLRARFASRLASFTRLRARLSSSLAMRTRCLATSACSLARLSGSAGAGSAGAASGRGFSLAVFLMSTG